MTSSTITMNSITPKWLPLAWGGMIFTFFIFMILGMISFGNPNKIIMGWGLFGDVAVFAIGLWNIGMILTVIFLAFFLRHRNLALADIGLRGSLTGKGFLFALAGAIVYFGIYHLTETILAPLGVTMFWRGGSSANLLAARTSVDWLILLIGPVIVSPVTEEIIFRGFVLTALKDRAKPFVLLFISALIFASVHVMMGPGLMVYIFLGSFIFGYLFLKYGNVYPSMLMHFVTNLWAYIFVPLLFLKN